MTERAGWCYVLTHPAWDGIGVVKIGMTGRDPAARAAEITSVSGLVAPCRVAWCAWVSDRAAVESTVKTMLAAKRVTGRRELFRADVATARAAIEAATCQKVTVPLVRRKRPPRWVHYRRRYPRRVSRNIYTIIFASLVLSYYLFTR